MSHPPALLLFDLDATLIHTGGAGLRAFERAGRRVFGDHFRAGDYNTAGMLDPVIFAELARANELDGAHTSHDAFQAIYFKTLAAELESGAHPYRVLPGVHELLDTLRRRSEARGDVVLGLLTGNYGPAVPIKLAPANIDPGWFAITAFGDEAQTRPDLVALALQRYEQQHGHGHDPERVIVIGDTPRDVDCALAHGCVAVGVTTGRYDRATLERAGAAVVLDDLADPSPVLKLIDADG